MGPSPAGWKIEFSMSGTTFLPLRNSLEMQTALKSFPIGSPNRKVPEKGLSKRS